MNIFYIYLIAFLLKKGMMLVEEEPMLKGASQMQGE